ncbi:MAG TPA: nucleotidyl transferase AbiEii/AbiGii toxin family protein [Deltaproteobacteria bacterium]|mgnify:CR=1 FL=1|nr:nucleotidyl transferase AbiEii/AbiGii toxin family protein [Deltaproteobacteria bacterium]HPJ94955.1 nucleotidyl transferase AbiEii/AbiGii toxin family protein [Deltaproteobacteria bacterium]HPR52717.1 nucleotidyl transferase AbiEii/AbiGii toxin family protein [Deltaproteobacteria bacterium]
MFEKILAGLGTVLQDHKIPYMIIGGQAVLLYGEPRLTRDIDITLGVDVDHLEELLGIIEKLSLKPLPQDIQQFVRQTMVLPCLHEETGIRVDFIFSYSPYETQAIQRAKKIMIRNIEVCFASVEDLIIHKIFAGRPRDLEDVRSILVRNPDIDIDYIADWLEQFDASSEENNFLNSFGSIISDA